MKSTHFTRLAALAIAAALAMPASANIHTDSIVRDMHSGVESNAWVCIGVAASVGHMSNHAISQRAWAAADEQDNPENIFNLILVN